MESTEAAQAGVKKRNRMKEPREQAPQAQTAAAGPIPQEG
jgi:hypothetical protein